MQILETERIWDRLRDKYFEEWLVDENAWPDIRRKLEMIGDLREVMRKIDNAR